MKKCLSLILAMSFLVQCFFFNTSFAQEKTSYIGDEIGLLQALDIIDFDISSNDALNAKVTRGEFAVSAAKCMGITEKTEITNTRYFKDVSPMDRSAVYIHALYESGIVNGTGMGEFKPYENIKPEDAATLMLRVAGYHKICETEAEMSKLAARYDLMAGIESEYITNGQMAEMIYKVLMMPAPVLTSVNVKEETNQNSVLYKINDDETVLYENFRCYRIDGILSAAEGISIDGDVFNEDYVVIENVIYNNSFDDVYDLIGYDVVAFVKDVKSDLHEAVFICASGRNEVTEINLKNLEPVSADLKLSYYNDGSDRIKELTLPANVSVIKNGKAVNENISDAFNAGQGRAVIVNNGTNYVAKLSVYDSVLVSSVSKADNMIYAKYGQSLKLEGADIKRVKIVLSDGSEGTFDSIQSGMFLTVFRSENCIEVYVSGLVAEGTATAVYDDKIVIDNAEYEIEPTYATEAKQKISAGTLGTFWFNIYDELAYYDATAELSGVYGILVDVVKNEIFDITLKMKIFTTAGEMITADVVDEPEVDGEKCTSQQAYDDILNAGGGVFSQVITYEMNSDGKISIIDTVAPNPDGRGLAIRKSPVGNDTYGRVYNNATNMMLPDIVMKKSAKIVQIPAFEKAASADEKKFKIISTLQNDAEYDCIAYTSDTDGFYTDIVVMEREDDLTTFDQMDQPFMVADVSDIIDEKRHARKQLVLAGAISQNGGSDMGLMTFLVEEDYALTESDVRVDASQDPYNQNPGLPVMPDVLGVGDMIRVVINQDKEISKIKLLFDYDDPNDTMLNIKKKELQKAGNGRFAAGYAVKKQDNYVAMSTTAPNGDITEFAYFSGATNVPVIVFDEKRGSDKVYVGSYDDVITFEETGQETSVVIPVTFYGWPRSCFIYRYGR